MAKNWPAITIEECDWRELEHHSLVSISGIKLIAALDTPFLKRAMQSGSRSHKSLCDRIGPNTNKFWVVCEVAAQLWDRDAITEGEYFAVRKSIEED